ncbi:MAG: prepilin-type N-terminal cleavage/methylation domain-containing protein [Desulfobacterota bacterium]|nr:prepilin-type N-terminal cleavage/methylation domain-containing protein [Thermodesulfobacteriota bacterium]
MRSGADRFRKDWPRGFTLLEVIVSLAVLGFLLLILFAGFRLGLSAWERGESLKEENQSSRILSQILSRQMKSAVPYRVKPKTAEADHLAFEGKPRSMRFVSTLPLKRSRAEGLVYTQYRFEPEGGRLLLYEQRVLNRDFFEGDPKKEDLHVLLEGLADVRFEYYQEEDESKGISEQWLEEWDAKEKKELPGALRMTLIFRETGGKENTLSLLIPIQARKAEEVRIGPGVRRTVPRGGP